MKSFWLTATASFKKSALILILGGLTVFLLRNNSPIQAANCEEFQCTNNGDQRAYTSCLSDKMACLESKLADTKSQADTLSSAISMLNGKIQVQELQIAQTAAEIKQLENEIGELSTRITGLELSLDRMSTLLIERAQTIYKQGTTNPFLLLTESDSLSEFMTDYKYTQMAQRHISQVMKQAENQRLDYDQQKNLKEIKQTEVAKKKALLEKQQQDLNQQKQGKQNLLNITKNDEQRYQQLLSQARSEIASFKNFATSKGGGVVSAQNSPDGWYFSQRDERWANQGIGSSAESILNVGCLVSSTAMIKKKFGEDVTPSSIAGNSGYFFSNTAYMLKPWPAPSGYHYADAGFSQSKLDEELNKNPVIVRISAGPYGTHFVVIKEKKDGAYIMHDPWEGFDKKFTDFYSLGQISRISYLVK